MDSSGDEFIQSCCPQTSSRQISPKKDAVFPKTAADLREPISMPPELIVTSTTQNQDINVFERLYKTSDQSKGHLIVSKPLSRRGSCRKSPDLRSRRKLVRQNGEQSDPEYTAPSEGFPIKKAFWKALSNDNIPWSFSYNEHEELLRACSEKLAELKKKHKSRERDKIELDLIGTSSKLTPARRKIKRRAKSMRFERSTTVMDSQLHLESFKVKSVKPDYRKLDDEVLRRQNTKKPAPNRKFRKGGYVSLATVNGNNHQDQSGDESMEAVGTKKKKKTRKILQLSKNVKSAMNAVTAVTVTRKDNKKEVSKRKF